MCGKFITWTTWREVAGAARPLSAFYSPANCGRGITFAARRPPRGCSRRRSRSASSAARLNGAQQLLHDKFCNIFLRAPFFRVAFSSLHESYFLNVPLSFIEHRNFTCHLYYLLKACDGHCESAWLMQRYYVPSFPELCPLLRRRRFSITEPLLSETVNRTHFPHCL